MNSAIKEGEKKFRKIDLLVNCAGIMLLGHPETQDYNELDRMIDVNIKGILTGTNIVLKDMVAINSGTIINISSIASGVVEIPLLSHTTDNKIIDGYNEWKKTRQDD